MVLTLREDRAWLPGRIDDDLVKNRTCVTVRLVAIDHYLGGQIASLVHVIRWLEQKGLGLERDTFPGEYQRRNSHRTGDEQTEREPDPHAATISSACCRSTLTSWLTPRSGMVTP